MPEKTIKRRLQDTRDAALASDDGPSSRPLPSWSTHSRAPFPRGRKTRSEKKKPCVSGANCPSGPSTRSY